MPMASKKGASAFRGLWHIVSLTGWDEELLDGEVRAFIEFEPNGLGAVEFAYVRATLDYRLAEREGRPAVEFSWSGVADAAPVCGRGWAVRDGAELHGMMFFHLGDEYGFGAQRAKAQPRPKRKQRGG
jgi:hypothetical protein